VWLAVAAAVAAAVSVRFGCGSPGAATGFAGGHWSSGSAARVAPQALQRPPLLRQLLSIRGAPSGRRAPGTAVAALPFDALPLDAALLLADAAEAVAEATYAGQPVPVLVLGVLAVLFSVGLFVQGATSQTRAGFLSEGEVVGRFTMEGGGSLRVTRHPDVARSAVMPPGTPRDARQEWRVMRFEQCAKYLQGVSKVCVLPDGRLQLLEEVLSLPYNRSLVAATLTSLTAIGAPVLEAAAGRKSSARLLKREEGDEALPKEVMRILCVGLGSGAVPAFFAQALPGCHVDVVELEPCVVEAACKDMAFQPGPRLHVATGDGAAFAMARAEEFGSRGGAYDAVVVDAFTSEGSVPEVFWKSGVFADALGKGLLRERAVIAVNFLPQTDLTPAYTTYRRALQEAGRTPGMSFSLTAEEGNLMTIQTCGGPTTASQEDWKETLTQSARKAQLAVVSPFAFTEVLMDPVRIWRPTS